MIGYVAYLAGLSILHQKPPLIGFEAGAGLRAPGDVFSVRRIERRRIGAGTGGNFLRRRVARASGLPYIYRHDENFVVRAGRFDERRSGFGLDVAGVSELLTVGSNRIHVLAAEMEWRHIVIARREILWHRHPACGASGHLVRGLRFGRRDACPPHREDVCATVRANDK